MKTTMSPFDHSNRWRTWRVDEDAQLRREVAADERLGDIAAKHDRTFEAIKSRIRKLDLPMSESQKSQAFAHRPYR